MKASISILSPAIITAVLAMLAAPESIAMAATLEQTLTGGMVSLDVRYRYEHVDQNNLLKNADASTVRSRLGYGTGAYHGANAYLELENVTSVGAQDYNSGVNGKTDYSTVIDPAVSQIDQAYLAWTGPASTLIKLGRQVINLDNQRFVGRVDWRQNGQTFDAFNLVNNALPDAVITLAYLNNVDRVTANSARMRSSLLNARYSGLAVGAISGYAYLLDYDQQPNQSTQTYGLRVADTAAVGADKRILYAVEYAKQSDYAGNSAKYDLGYFLAELGEDWGGVTTKLGYELLEGDGAHSVQTPLATLHAFNGWADQFLVTPADGLKDAYFIIGGTISGVSLLAAYHDFKADKGGGGYGEEWDMQATRNFGKHYSLSAKYAGYNADDASGKVDTDKYWLVGQVAF